jgi:AhpC/TSA family
MERRRNFLPLAGFLVCLVAFLSYFLFFYQFPITRDVPWVSWLLFALGLALLAMGIARAFRGPESYRGRYQGRVLGPVLGVLSMAVLGLFLFATTVGSRDLPEAAGAPKVGEKVPDFVLQDSQGRSVRLYDLLGQKAGGSGSWVVLIFYRGYW